MTPSPSAFDPHDGFAWPRGPRLNATLGALCGVLALVWVSLEEIAAIGHLTHSASPESLGVGFCWAASVVWMIMGLWRDPFKSAANAPPRAAGFGDQSLRVCLALAASVLAGLDLIERGQRAQSGFLIGVGALTVVFLLTKVGLVGSRAGRADGRSDSAEPEQLGLPFA